MLHLDTWKQDTAAAEQHEPSGEGRQEVQAGLRCQQDSVSAPGGAPISFATECRSMYSDMSSRSIASVLPKYCSLRTCSPGTTPDLC